MFSRLVQIRGALAVPLRRTIYASPTISNAAAKHTSDSYNRDDIDPTPPNDTSVYRVDSTSEKVQKPHEAPSGEWSRAGVKTSEYQSASKTEPYAAPGQDLRYGGKESYVKDKGPETSKPDEGPNGKASGGRKPEGR
ncbi:hypothetical protein H0H87_009873 [Tephrocybe sp. NHM501043]|nr:hypothetical protein H0H87_009873 [Tephrocybe sp. NHM501043]